MDPLSNILSHTNPTSQKPTSDDISTILAKEQEKWLLPRENHLAPLRECAKNPAQFQMLFDRAKSPLEETWTEFLHTSQCTPSPLLQAHIKTIDSILQEDKAAVDIGCGNCGDTSYLLDKKWRVFSLDSTPSAIDRASRVFSKQQNSGQLSLHCTKMETFTFPKNVTLVFANDSLPYCEPAKLLPLLQKIHSALAPNGYFIGNFMPKPQMDYLEPVQRALLRVTYLPTDKFAPNTIVSKMLQDTHFKIISCDVAISLEGFTWVEFAAQKLST